MLMWGGCRQRWPGSDAFSQLCPSGTAAPAAPFPDHGSYLLALQPDVQRTWKRFPLNGIPQAPLHALHQGGSRLGSLGMPCTGSPYSSKITYFDKRGYSGGERTCLALFRLVWSKSNNVFSFCLVTEGCPGLFAVRPEPLGESAECCDGSLRAPAWERSTPGTSSQMPPAASPGALIQRFHEYLQRAACSASTGEDGIFASVHDK